MSDKTDATFLIALIIMTIVGLVATSAAHSADGAPQRSTCSYQNQCEHR